MRRPWARAFGLALSCAAGARAEAAADVELQVRGGELPRGDRREPARGREARDRRASCASAAPTRASPDRIAVRCDDAGARHRGHDGGAQHARRPSTSARSRAEHRARALALAAAELVHAMIGAPARGSAARRGDAADGHDRHRPSVALDGASPRLTRAAPPPPARPDAARRRSRAVAGTADGACCWAPASRFVIRWAGSSCRRSRSTALSGACPVPSAGVIAIQTVAAAVHVYVGTTIGTPSLRRRRREHAGAGSISRDVPDAGSTLEGRSLAASWGGPEVRARVGYGGERTPRSPWSRSSSAPASSRVRCAACATERRPSTRWRAPGSRSASTSAWASEASAGTTASRLERQPHRRAQPEPAGRSDTADGLPTLPGEPTSSS